MQVSKTIAAVVLLTVAIVAVRRRSSVETDSEEQ